MRVPLAYVIILLLVTAYVLPTLTRAEGTGRDAQWGVVPVPGSDPATTAKGYFVYPIAPGAQASGQVLLRNPTASAVTIELFPVTAQTAQAGGSAFATEDGSASGVASWIRLDERRATIAPGTERPVNFTVQAPPATSAGQYLTGIAAQAEPDAAQDAARSSGMGASLTMRSRYVIAVQLDVGDSWQSAMSVRDVRVVDQPSSTVIGVELSNDGGSFLKPSGTVSISDASDKELFAFPVKMGTFVPGTTVTYPITWPGKPTAGSYKISVDLAYADGKHATYADTFEVSSAVAQHAAERANAVHVPQAAQALAVAAPQPSGIAPWMFYTVVGLLMLSIIVLVAYVARGRSKAGKA